LIVHPIFKSRGDEKVPRSQISNYPLIVPGEMDSSLNIGENLTYLLKRMNINIVFQDSYKLIKRM
jgi:hypothetical protein